MAKKARREFLTICPKCNSADVGADFSNPALVSTGLFNNAKICNHCGHSANFFPEVKANNLSKVKKRKKKKSDLVNTTYGKNINWWWRFSGPFGIALSIVFLFYYNVESIFYLGLIGLLPISCILTLTSHRNDLIQKYIFLRVISVIIYIYSITIAPIVIIYLADLL